MKKIHTTALFIVAITLIVGGLYTYFSYGESVHAEVPVSTDSSLVSQTGVAQAATTSDPSSLDITFLATLSSLKTIKIDTSLFTNRAFQKLKDNTVKLDEVKTGRPNPFAPITSTATSQSVTASVVNTNQPLKVTTNTAILSGTVNNSSVGVSTYFEYGATPSLGKTTTPVAPSLIGTFITNISGLSSQTVYFYRAVVKVNGKPLYGDVVTFETQ